MRNQFVTFKLDEPLRLQLEQHAQKTERSLSSVIRIALRDHLEATAKSPH